MSTTITGASGNSKFQITTYPTWPSTFSPTDSTKKYSVYATYATSSSSAASSSPHQILQNIFCSYDPVGNITQIADHSDTGAGKVVNFNYDALNRLTFASTTAASSSPYRYSWAYDLLGNITGYATSTATTTYAYAGTGYANPDAVTSIGSATVAYDNAGNETSSGSNSFTWDWRGHPQHKPHRSDLKHVQLYDENDRRVRPSLHRGIATTAANRFFRDRARWCCP
jgi:RHS Repeat